MKRIYCIDCADIQDIATPANFGVFRDTLLTRLRSMLTVRSDFEKRIKQTEANMEKQVG